MIRLRSGLLATPLRQGCFGASRAAHRAYSSSGAEDEETFYTDYLRRAAEKLSGHGARIIRDPFTPQPSYLLKKALWPHIPEICHWGRKRTLDPGHHLVYFPPNEDAGALMADGTEEVHCPGEPFVRRMWAGGSVKYNLPRASAEILGKEAFCLETMSRPVLKRGRTPQEDKVFVDVRRRYGHVNKWMNGMKPWQVEDLVNRDVFDKMVLIDETRKLVFLRKRELGQEGEEKKDADDAASETAAATKPSPSPLASMPRADFSFTLTPDPTLLFHFSALSHNAHRIHFDPEYARDVEGYARGPLVHGPLTLVLMLVPFPAYPWTLWPSGRMDVASVEYRNLRPLHVGEPMKVCVSLSRSTLEELGVDNVGELKASDFEDKPAPQWAKWTVWIEGPDGRLAAKGTVVTKAFFKHLKKIESDEGPTVPQRLPRRVLVD